MEPISAIALSALSTIGSGILGNAAHQVADDQWQTGIKALKARKDPDQYLINHDLERAVMRSLYRAQITLVADCLKDLTKGKEWQGKPWAMQVKDQDTVNWLQHHQTTLKQQIASLDKPDAPTTPIAPSEVEWLLNSRVSSVVLNDHLCDEVLTMDYPKLYRDWARQEPGLYERVCLCFAYEIKTNDPVRRIFDSQMLVQINDALTQMQQSTVSSEQIEAVLKQIANLPDLERKLNAIDVAVQQLGIDQEDGFEQVFGEFAKQANTLEEILALLRQLVAQPAASKPLPTVVGLSSLTSVPVWVGRDQVLADLTAVLLAESSPQVMVITGQGGMGKSSLALKLLEAIGVDTDNHALTESCPFERVLCIRAEEGSSFEDFARTMLANLGKQVQLEQPTPKQLLAALLQSLSQERCLLVLDNLETLLHPASMEQAGRCESADWGRFLQALANNNHQSLALITSRELPLDLADARSPSGTPNRRRVTHHSLEGISQVDSVTLLRELGLEDSDEDLQWIAKRVQGQVLVLTLLADFALDQPGYLRQHPHLVTENAEPVLREQLQRQSEPATELLKRMAVLRYPVDAAGLTFLRFYTDEDERFEIAARRKEPAELTDAEQRDTQDMVRRLVRSSLVQERYDKTRFQQFYDLHRVVSDFLKQEYAPDQPNLLKIIYQFYRSGCTVDDPKTLDDLRPILEAQHFAMQLGNTDEAFNLLANQLWEPLYYWGYWALLRDLYTQILPKLQDPANYRICVWSLGILHRGWGDWDTAEGYFQDSLNNARQHDSQRGIATSLGMLGDIERYRGHWDTAEHLYRQKLEICEALGDRSGIAAVTGTLGNIERDRGHWDTAEQLYRQKLEICEALGDRSGMASSYGSLGEVELGRGNLDKAEELLNDALERFESLGNKRWMPECTFRIAQVWQRRGDTATAETHYTLAHQLYTELGAMKDLERIEREWGE